MANEQVVTHEVRFINSFLKELLEAVTDILDGIGEHDKYFNTLRKRSRCIYNEDSDCYVYDFKRTSLNNVLFLLRNRPDLDYEDTLETYNFDPDGWWIEDRISVQEPVMLAIRMREVTLAYKLYIGCKKVLDEIQSKDEEMFTEPFPMKLFLKLKGWLKDFRGNPLDSLL